MSTTRLYRPQPCQLCEQQAGQSSEGQLGKNEGVRRPHHVLVRALAWCTNRHTTSTGSTQLPTARALRHTHHQLVVHGVEGGQQAVGHGVGGFQQLGHCTWRRQRGNSVRQGRGEAELRRSIQASWGLMQRATLHRVQPRLTDRQGAQGSPVSKPAGSPSKTHRQGPRRRRPRHRLAPWQPHLGRSAPGRGWWRRAACPQPPVHRDPEFA